MYKSYRYNRLGNLVEYKESCAIEEYTYNNKNLLVKEVEHCTEKIYSKNIYTYYERNLLKEIDVYEYDDKEDGN